MDNKITFLLTVYKPKTSEIDWWKNAYKKIIDKGHQFIVLNDNVEINGYEEIFPDALVVNNEVNLGKYHSIISSREHWKNSFLKILDPDDFIVIENIDKVCESLNMDAIYRMPYKSIRQIPEDTSDINLEKIYGRLKNTKHGNTLGNPWTILPTSSFQDENKFSKKRIDFNDDQLLGQICLADNKKVIDIDNGFYIYLFENGISNKNNILNYLNKLENTIIEYSRLKQEYEYDNVVNWPNFVYYNALKNKNIHRPKIWFESNRRIKELKKMMK